MGILAATVQRPQRINNFFNILMDGIALPVYGE
jgi:hypothetical protein